ncbi:MAG: spore cortex-lytic enzyme [Firmicutes bacterium]|nr:spore cortex-lytic enzyme [Bacillota bacterium]
MRRIALSLVAVMLVLLLWGLAEPVMVPDSAEAQTRPTLHWGSTGYNVRLVQWKLQSWGYYRGRIDGVFGTQTSQAVRRFQARNGLTPDGLVGPRTWAALGFGTAAPAAARVRAQSSRGVSRNDNVDLLARVVAAEAEGEPYAGQVAVAATILNRVRNPRFPNTLNGVIFQPHAFESVTNGLIWRRTPSATAYRAARDALNGYDPTYGAIFFWNPSKPVNPWIWSRSIITRIGSHVFAR